MSTENRGFSSKQDLKEACISPMGQQGYSPFHIHHPAWQNEYRTAVVEHDPKKLLERIHVAEAAIFNRLQELARKSENSDGKAEQQAIEDALSALRVLKRERLGFPEWENQ